MPFRQSRLKPRPQPPISHNTGMVRKVVGALVALTLVAALTGCAEPESDNVGGQQRPQEIRRIVSLSPSLTEIIGTKSRNLLVGKTMACDYPTGLTMDNVVKGTEIDFELVKSLEPDLVVYDKDLYSQADIAKLEQLGVMTKGYAPKTLEEYEEMAIEISQLTGSETRASNDLDDIYRVIELAHGAVPENTVSSVVLMGGGSSEYMAAGTGTLLSDLLTKSNVVFQGPEAPNFAPINVEQIIAWNPDMILATTESAELIIKDPRLSTLDAVKNQRVFGINPDILLRAGDRLDVLIGAVEQQAQRIAIAKQG